MISDKTKVIIENPALETIITKLVSFDEIHPDEKPTHELQCLAKSAYNLEEIDKLKAREQYQAILDKLRELIKKTPRGCKEENMILLEVEALVSQRMLEISVHRTKTSAVDDGHTVEHKTKKKRLSRQIQFVEQRVVYFYTNMMAPVETSKVVNGFVSQKVKNSNLELSVLYRQCLHCLLVPLRPTKMHFGKLTALLMQVFRVEPDFHNKLLSTEKIVYSKSTVAANLRHQLQNLEENTFYTKKSFLLNPKKDGFKIWQMSETQRIQKHLEKFSDEVKIDDYIEIVEPEEDGFPWYTQLLTCLLSYDSTLQLQNPRASSEINSLMNTIQEDLLKGDTGTPFILDSYLESKQSRQNLFVLSRFSKWLLSDYSERYGIRSLYRQIAYLHLVSKNLKLSTRELVTVHYLLHNLLEEFKTEDVVFNHQEYRLFKEVVKKLFKEVEGVFLSNIFRHFSLANLGCFVMCTKLLLLLLDCHSFFKSKSKNQSKEQKIFKYKPIMTECVMKSFQNWHREVLYQVESKNLNLELKDEDRITPAPPSFLGGNKNLTPRQLLNVMNDLWGNMVPQLNIFANLLSGLDIDLKKVGEDQFFSLLYADVKFFTRKYLFDYRPYIVLSMGVRFKEIADQQERKEDIQWHQMFGTLPSVWLLSVYDECKELANTQTKKDVWQSMDDERPYSKSAHDLCEKLEYRVDLVEKLKFLEVEDDVHMKGTFMEQYGRIMGRSMLIYLENVYNMFVLEFPVEQHALLHDVYLRSTFKFTNTGGSLHNKPKKRRSIRWPGKKTKEDERLEPSPLTDLIKWEIKIWSPKIVYHKKKKSHHKKFRKPRNCTSVTGSMFIKINSIEHLRSRMMLLLARSPPLEFDTSLDQLLSLERRIFNSFIGILIYSMDLYIAAQLEYLLRKTKSKKKMPIKLFREMQILYRYIAEQINILPDYFNFSHCQKFAEKLWITLLKSIDELVAEDKMQLSYPQICIVEDFLEYADKCISRLKISAINITEQRLELMKRVLRDVDLNSFVTFKTDSFLVEKEEFLKKEPPMAERAVVFETSEISRSRSSQPSSTRSSNQSNYSSNPSSGRSGKSSQNSTPSEGDGYDSSDDWLLNSDDYPKISARYVHKDGPTSSDSENDSAKGKPHKDSHRTTKSSNSDEDTRKALATSAPGKNDEIIRGHHSVPPHEDVEEEVVLRRGAFQRQRTPSLGDVHRSTSNISSNRPLLSEKPNRSSSESKIRFNKDGISNTKTSPSSVTIKEDERTQDESKSPRKRRQSSVDKSSPSKMRTSEKSVTILPQVLQISEGVEPERAGFVIRVPRMTSKSKGPPK